MSMIEGDDKAWKCDICGRIFKGGYSNDPWPILEELDAECCDECNWSKVLPARIEKLKNNKEANHEFHLRG